MSSHTSKGKIFLTEGIKYDDLRCKGKVTAEGRISAASINIKDKLSADDITADSSFDFKGKISAGSISAQDVKIITGSDGKAATITGGKVFIRCENDPEMAEEFMNFAEGILRLFHIDTDEIRDAEETSSSEKKATVFRCGEISGSDIELYGVTCRTVSGENITLKGGCHIDTVSYTGKYEADDSCVIGRAVKA
ncbi:MAG: hypothetical protein IJS39_12545 [Synergistaceae bacterium]|nr:hypothetical protein [Synergistaceae bacterium]